MPGTRAPADPADHQEGRCAGYYGLHGSTSVLVEEVREVQFDEIQADTQIETEEVVRIPLGPPYAAVSRRFPSIGRNGYGT